jgi:hypothetical protein
VVSNFIIAGPLQFVLACNATDDAWASTCRKLIGSFHVDEKRIREIQSIEREFRRIVASKTSTHNHKSKRLQDFNGVYVGVMPSDAADLGLGEIEMNIHCNGLTARIASGEHIVVVERRCEDYTPMSIEEIKREFAGKSPYVSRIDGFRYKDGSWPAKLLFIHEPQYDWGEYGMIIRSEQTDGFGNLFGFGSVVLLSPEQIRRGIYQQFISDLEKRFGKNRLPLLKYNGKTTP